ncbi:MAG: hypothetical protein ACXVZR_03820 [Terriglobales bacterium]
MSDNEQKNGPDPLDQIGLEAAGMEAQAAAKQQEILDPEPVIDPAATWAAIPKLFGSLIQMAMPELAGVYTDEACYAWGGAFHEVAKKHNWDAVGTMTRWGPEIGLVFASVPLVLPTVQAIRARRAEAEKKKPAKPADIQDGVTVPPPQDNGTAGANNAPQGGNFVDPT